MIRLDFGKFMKNLEHKNLELGDLLQSQNQIIEVFALIKNKNGWEKNNYCCVVLTLSRYASPKLRSSFISLSGLRWKFGLCVGAYIVN